MRKLPCLALTPVVGHVGSKKNMLRTKSYWPEEELLGSLADRVAQVHSAFCARAPQNLMCPSLLLRT